MAEEPNIIGSWRKLSILGSGGFGVVSLWRNEDTSECVAVKKCRWHMPSQIPAKQKERWMQEVQIMREIDHENIVRFKTLDDGFAAALDKYNPSRLALLSMEYCTKGNLRRALKSPKNACGLPEAEVRYLLKDLNSAIAYLHSRNITHRDIKPENVVLQETDYRPNKTIYKLIDLGYAKELGSVVASFVGTLHYLAPEIFKNNNYSCNVDYWSFGILVFEVVCSLHPFMLNPKLSPVERFQYIEKKADNHICIYSTRSGEIKYSHEIVKEHHLSSVFKHHLEEWLRSMLRFDPEARGKLDGQRTVFDKLAWILSRRVVRIFNLVSFQYLYYEVDEETLVRSLQEWIARDVGVPLEEQLLLTENIYYEDDPQRKVIQCFDEFSCETTVYLFKKRHYVSKDEEVKLPATIKSLMRNHNKSYNWDELYQQISTCVHYLLNETNLMSSLKKALEVKFHYTGNLMRRQRAVSELLNESARKLLVEIEVYRDLHEEVRVLADGRNAENVRVYRKLLWQSRELLENVNGACARHQRLLKVEKLLQKSYENVCEKLQQYKPEEIYKKGFDCMTIPKLSFPLTSSEITGVIFGYFKERNSLVNDSDVEDYLMASYKILREINRLVKWTSALDLQAKRLHGELKANQIAMFRKVSSQKGRAGNLGLEDEFDGEDLLEANRNMRYQYQELFSRLKMDFEEIQKGDSEV